MKIMLVEDVGTGGGKNLRLDLTGAIFEFTPDSHYIRKMQKGKIFYQNDTKTHLLFSSKTFK